MGEIQLHTQGWLCVLPVIAYLYGSVPFGFLAAKLLKGVDIRQSGSGNIGATNAARVLGFRFFPLIFLLDVSKGFLPTLAAGLLVAEGAY
ncbi:MAG: glycerol-3-phosphate acyltransferase, partial [Planctomycetota bacterium]